MNEDNTQVEVDQAEVSPMQDQESPDQVLNELLELMSTLQSNPFDYSLHQRNVALCRKLGADTIEELNQARSLMAEYFPVKDEFFMDWVSDTVSAYQSPYHPSCVQKVLDLYEQASSYAFFPKIESARLQYIIDLYYYARGYQRPTGKLIELIQESSEDDTDAAPVLEKRTEEQLALVEMITDDQVRSLAIDVMDKIGYHLLESSATWNMWALHEFDVLKRNWNGESFARFKSIIQARLCVPHTDSSETFQMYSSLITRHENDCYEEELVAVNALYSPSRELIEDREVHEAQLKNSSYSLEEYLKYISWEMSQKPPNFDLAHMLFERALVDHSTCTELWLECMRYLNQQRDQLILSTSFARRATRTVPWSGDIWASAIRIFERNNQVVEVVEQLCTRAIQSKFLEHDIEALVAFTIGRADFHRRRLDAYIAAGGAENSDQVQSLIDMVANSLQRGIDTTKQVLAKSGDPSCRVEKYLANLYEHHGQHDNVSKIWQKATKQYRNFSAPWISAAEFEERHGNLTRARDYYKKSSNIKLDYPEYLLEAWLTFEHHFGSLEDLEYAISKVNNIMKGISARRKREAEQNSTVSTQLIAAAGNTSEISVPGKTDENNETRKRKLDAMAESESAGEKKLKTSTSQAEHTVAPNDVQPVELKRDRENSTVLLAGLTVETSKAKISQLFRDCGNIREIVIHKVKTNDVVATVEFEDRASVLAAQTKDKKLLNGVEVTVSLAWRSTLYVTNFPEDANDEWIRNKFSPFGNIFDVRWPSKRFKSTRRFCYIQFTAPESAEGAISLHNLEVAPNQKMVVLISDPARKQTRSDTNANDREIYITCLSKFVQEPDLRKLFTQFGEIKGIRLILNQAGHSKGFAFVEFENEMSAKAALAMNNVELKKKRIGVTISSGKGLSLVRKNTAFTDEAKLSSVTDHRSRSVKVSNLPEGSQEALIQQAFEPFGKVLKTITYPETNEALVEFALGKDAGRVFLHKEPIVINGQHVEVSVPITSVKVGLPTSNSSFTPLLPRSTVKGQKSRIGLGSASTAARLVPKASSLNQNVTQSSEVKDLETPNRNPSVPSSTNVGKTQSDFRKMLG